MANQEGSPLKEFDTEAEARRYVAGLGDKETVHALPLTPDLKQAALSQGFPLFQQGAEGPRGQMRFGPERQFNIDLLQTADLSTFLHETGHFYLEVLNDLSQQPEVSEDITEDLATIRAWVGATEGQPFTVAQHEQFARGFEAYLREGKAPSEGLQAAFERFQAWLLDIYKTLTQLDVELTDEVRGVFDRLLVAPEQAEDTSFEFGENLVEQATTLTEQLPEEQQDVMALQIEQELLQEQLAFRKRVGKFRKPAGGAMAEELAEIPASYFTTASGAPTIDKAAQELGYESAEALREAILAYEQLKPGRQTRLRELLKIIAEIQRTTRQDEASARQFLGAIQRTLVNLLKGRGQTDVSELNVPTSLPRLRQALEAFREAHGQDPQAILTRLQELLQAPAEATTEEAYAANRIQQHQLALPVRSVVRDAQSWAEKAFVPISTRLAKINESLKHRLRRFDFDVNTRTQKDLKTVEPFLQGWGKLSEAEAADLDFALKNRDQARVQEILESAGMTEAFQTVRAKLEDIYARAQQVGFMLGYMEAYYPRRVKDAAGFLSHLRKTEAWSAIAEAIALKETELGQTLDTEERAQFVNALLRGFGGTQIRLDVPANVKSRLIEQLTPEMNRFYHHSGRALVDYLTAMNNAIESRRFFGKDAATLDQSIGRYVDRLVQDGQIDAAQEAQAKAILKARFEQHGTTGMIRLYKNLAYIYTMGSPISAVTQLGDLAFSLYKNGYYATGRVLGPALRGKVVATKEDLGLSRIAEEFTGDSTSAKAVSAVFKLIGLEKLDAIGKDALIQGAWNRLTARATADPVALTEELQPIFSEQAAEVVEDLRAGRVSEDVKYLLFSELADVQPVSLSEMPEDYLSGGNYRILYMLKSYTLKQLDVFHNEVGQQMQTDPKKALTNLVRLSTALMLVNAGADLIKDLLLGRDKELPDYVVDNLLRLLGFSKWQIYKTREDGLLTAFIQSILPPVPFFDDLYKDVVGQRDLPNWRIWGRVPLVGKFYYWWFGGGSDSAQGF